MKSRTILPQVSLIPVLIFLFAACGKADKALDNLPGEEPSTTVSSKENTEQSAAPGEQSVRVDQIMQAMAEQQAGGLGGGRVTVNGAWNYNGFSYLSPDPNAAIEARLVAVDITVAGHTEHFDFDDIEIVDGANLMSYGSDPHLTPLTLDGEIMSEGQAAEAPPAASRWLLIYAYPVQSPAFHLYYWGKALTNQAVSLSAQGMELPHPPAEK